MKLARMPRAVGAHVPQALHGEPMHGASSWLHVCASVYGSLRQGNVRPHSMPAAAMPDSPPKFRSNHARNVRNVG
jgi:hypothetical protein